MRRLLTTFVLFAIGVLLACPASAQDIERAYQKEFAYLKAQKEALQSRAATLDAETEREAKKVEAEIATLQNRLVNLQLQADTLQEELATAERETTRAAEHDDSLFAVMEQARASLERYGVELPEAGDEVKPADVRMVFDRAMPVIEEGGAIRTGEGEFFLQDGEQVTGEVIHVGRIAAYGVSDSAAGALVPAGENRLKLWSKDASATARAYAGGGRPEAVKLFLFESTEKAVEEKTEKSWLDTVNAGGIIAWVIVGLGVAAILLALLRVLLLLGARTPSRVVDEVCEAVRVGRMQQARRVIDQARGATARVLRRAVDVVDSARETADDAIAEAILDETPRIERFGTAIMVFAAVSPLLGLLGTVTGMIATFDVITEYGTGDPKMLSGGISEALITTQLGLIVAIPALLVGNLLNARASSQLDDMEQAALRVTNAARLDTPPPDDRPDEEHRASPKLLESKLAEAG
jgi:biopolymer transport protein ExbB